MIVSCPLTFRIPVLLRPAIFGSDDSAKQHMADCVGRKTTLRNNFSIFQKLQLTRKNKDSEHIVLDQEPSLQRSFVITLSTLLARRCSLPLRVSKPRWLIDCMESESAETNADSDDCPEPAVKHHD